MRFARALFLLVGLSLTASGWAHDPGLSSARLVILRESIELRTTFSATDARWLVPKQEGEEFPPADGERLRAELKSSSAFWWRLFTERAELSPSVTSVEFAPDNNVVFTQYYSRPTIGTIHFHSGIFELLPPGHRQHATVIDDQNHVVLAKLLSQAASGLDVPLPPLQATAETKGSEAGVAANFGEFFRLGVEHIVTGYDHLLFLFALLITAKGVRPVLKIITSFTLAHSITLAFSAFGFVSVPSRWIEPLIAGTIVFVAFQNLARRDRPGERVGLTFVFGLIHGFGFASVLQEMGISSLGPLAWRALAGFNLGVELGQIAIASVVLPLVWSLRSRTDYERAWTPTVSSLIALAGAYWFFERTGWL